MRNLRILNLGAGLQSTTLYLMSLKQTIPESVPLYDYAIFADTQEEPTAVYHHLQWLQSLGGPPILIGTAGKLGDNLLREENPTGGRFASIPAYTAKVEGGDEGRTKRQCTKEYKIEIIEQIIRYQIVGLERRHRFPIDEIHIEQHFGLSFDEHRRRARVLMRFHGHRWASAHFPLFDLFMTRGECRAWLEQQEIPHPVPRSACTFCPFHSNAEWRDLRDHDPESWKRAIEVDEGLRREGAVVNRGLSQKLYVHRSCIPLSRANIDTPEPQHNQQRFAFGLFGVVEEECEGMCGI
jgi:hypothetical protein